MEFMTLGDFISNVIKQIVEGVAAAQEDVAKLGGEVNPWLHNLAKLESKGGVLTTYEDVVQSVDFDVAITTVDETAGKAGLAVFKSELSASRADRDHVVSRVRFTVPVRLSRIAKGQSE